MTTQNNIRKAIPPSLKLRRASKTRIEKLREEINHHRYLYHVLDTQEISEAALDSLKHDLTKLEEEYPEFITADSPTQRVGGQSLDKFQKVNHQTPMLSLNDVFSLEELSDWEKRNTKMIPGTESPNYFTELKIDGFAVSLIYKNGIFYSGSTRGDGLIGEDVTQNLKTIEAIPLQLISLSKKEFLENVEIRGEVYLTKKDFALINQEQKKKKLPLFANPRNIASGSIRQLDSRLVKERHLNFLAYTLVTDLGQKTHQEEHQILKSLGFKTDHLAKILQNKEEINLFWQEIIQSREKLPYQIDGLVININDNKIFQNLGVVGKAPRGAVAYKFPAEEATTIVKNITIQIGRTGVATPVAELEKVLVYGSQVKRATLHNIEEIQRLDLRIGDTVIIRKAGDVIPEIVSVIKNLRPENSVEFIMPEFCPICNSKLIHEVLAKPSPTPNPSQREGHTRISPLQLGGAGGGANKEKLSVGLFCQNESCQAKHREYFYYFVSKKAFNIDGLGPKIIDAFYDLGLIRNPIDIFKLKKEDIEGLEGFGEKSAQNLLQAIEASKNISLAKFIYALGIRHIGEINSKDLAKYFGEFGKLEEAVYKLQAASYKHQEIQSPIRGLAEKGLGAIMNWFALEKNKIFLKEILKIVKIKNAQAFAPLNLRGAAGNPAEGFSGQIFVITGSLSKPREYFVDLINNLGGQVTSVVSKKTDYLLLGEQSGKISSKEKTARKLNIKIISEADFEDFIDTAFQIPTFSTF